MAVDKRRVIGTMRDILRDQCSSSCMDQAVVRYIFAENLLRITEWPGWLISLTEKGRTYMLEHGEQA